MFGEHNAVGYPVGHIWNEETELQRGRAVVAGGTGTLQPQLVIEIDVVCA